MTLEQFIAKWQGRYCDYDSYYGPQCVDLANQYLGEVLSLPPLSGNAVDLWETAPASYTRVPNGPTNMPPPGAVIIWHQDAAAGTTQYGHVAVADEAITMAFISFDQNWPTGAPCHSQAHTYDGVTGWLLPPGLSTPPSSDKPGPPKNAADAVDTMLRHSTDLTAHPSVQGTNDLINSIRSWPVYTA